MGSIADFFFARVLSLQNYRTAFVGFAIQIDKLVNRGGSELRDPEAGGDLSFPLLVLTLLP
jgi:hypothetical protein